VTTNPSPNAPRRRRLAIIAAAAVLATAACGTTTDTDAPAAKAEAATPAASAKSDGKAPGSSKDTPGAIGESFVLKDADNGDLTVAVTAFLPDATAEIAAANQFNKPAAPGKRYVIATVTASYKGGAKKQTTTLMAAVGWSMFGASAVEAKSYECSAVVPGKIDDTAELLDGGSVTGNICFQLAEADAAGPLLLRASESLCFSNCDAAWVKVQ
jgi:hypothetical protein